MAMDPYTQEQMRNAAKAQASARDAARLAQLQQQQSAANDRGVARFGLRNTAMQNPELGRLTAQAESDKLAAAGDKRGAVRIDPRARGDVENVTSEVASVAVPALGAVGRLGGMGVRAGMGLREAAVLGREARAIPQASYAFNRRPSVGGAPFTGAADAGTFGTPVGSAPGAGGMEGLSAGWNRLAGEVAAAQRAGRPPIGGGVAGNSAAGLRAPPVGGVAGNPAAAGLRAPGGVAGNPAAGGVAAEAQAARGVAGNPGAGGAAAQSTVPAVAEAEAAAAANPSRFGKFGKYVPGKRAVLTGLGTTAALAGLAAFNQSGARPPEEGEADEAAAPPPPDPTRFITAGRNAKGELVASSEGPQNVIGLGEQSMPGSRPPTGLRTINFKPETEEDVKKAAAANEMFYKNIGGDLGVQQQRVQEALGTEAALYEAAGRGGGGGGGLGGGRGARGAGDSLDQATLLKSALEAQKQSHDVEDDSAKNELSAMAAYNKKLSERRREYADQELDLTNPLVNDLIQASVVMEDDPDLTMTPVGQALRKRLLSNTATEVEGGREVFADDPRYPLDETNGPKDFSGIRHGEAKGLRYAGDWLAGPLYDPQGTLEYTDPSGEVYSRNFENSPNLRDPKVSRMYMSVLNQLRAPDAAAKKQKKKKE